MAVQFPLYERFKDIARDRHDSDDLTPGIILTCSSSAKMIASVLTYPHEVLRTRLQMQPRLAKDNVSSSTTTPLAAAGQQQRVIHTASMDTRPRQPGLVPLPSTLQSSAKRRRGISSMGNTGNRYTGVIQACTTIAREEGLRGFYRGMGVNLVRTVPSSALTILTYEVMMQHLTADTHDSDDNVGQDTK